MPSARLLQVNCPQCGAHLRFSAEDEAVTCRYCGATSLVASLLPLVPQGPSGSQGRALGVAVILAGAIGALLLVAGIAAALLLRSPSGHPSRALDPPPAIRAFASVREGRRLLPSRDVGEREQPRQHALVRGDARALGRGVHDAVHDASKRGPLARQALRLITRVSHARRR
jgi:hypothetical protein